MNPLAIARNLPAPRLLPATIAVMMGLLVVKSVSLVSAAVPQATSPAGAAPPAAAPASDAPQPPVAPPAPTAPSVPPPPEMSDSERALLQELRARRNELDSREAALAARENVLAAAETRLGARVAELKSLQTRLESLEAARQHNEDAGWQGLVKVYESMKPRDAAIIFNDLDPSVLLPVADRMKEARAAPILAAMQPDRARQLTAELARLRAQRNAVADAIPR